MRPQLEWDKEADAVYVRLGQGTYTFGRDLDEARRVDFAEDETPIGVELLYASEGVNVEGLPQQESIAALLEERGIGTYALKGEQESKGDASSAFFAVDFEPSGTLTQEGHQVDQEEPVTA